MYIIIIIISILHLMKHGSPFVVDSEDARKDLQLTELHVQDTLFVVVEQLHTQKKTPVTKF